MFAKDWLTNGTGHPKPGGNNDVWILTDHLTNPNGTANFNSIYAATSNLTHHADHDGDPPSYDAGGAMSEFHWVRSNTNGLGTTYLDLYSRGALGEFSRGSNYMPRGYSLWDAPISDYHPAEWNPDTPSTIPGLAIDPRDPVPSEPYALQYRNSTTLTTNVAVDHTGNSYIGTSSLRLTQIDSALFGGLGGENYVTFGISPPGPSGFSLGLKENAEDNLKYRIDIPKGKRWIFSYYVKANAVPQTTVWSEFLFSNTTHYNAGKITGDKQSIVAADEWQRYSQIVDLTSGTTTEADAEGGSLSNTIIAVVPVLWANAHQTQSTDYYFDAIQLEEVGPDVYTPSEFKEPSDASALLFGRRITDGKIVTHLSPEFPSDTSGAAPWGDPASDWYFGPIPNVKIRMGFPIQNLMATFGSTHPITICSLDISKTILIIQPSLHILHMRLILVQRHLIQDGMY